MIWYVPSQVFSTSRSEVMAFVLAATGKTLQLSRAAGKRPGAFEGDLSAGSGDPAFKGAEVAVAVGMLVDEVAALRTVASDQIGRAPVGDFGIVPLLIS